MKINNTLKKILSLAFVVGVTMNISCIRSFAITTVDQGIIYECYTDAGTASVIGVENNNSISGDIVIAGTVNGCLVTSIEPLAFDSCESLVSVTFPQSLQSIGVGAFIDCTNLRSINIPKNVERVAYNSFAGSTSLQAIDVDAENEKYCSINGVLYSRAERGLICYPEGKIGDSFSIPQGVTSIGTRAFAGCRELTQIEIPESVTNINCDSLIDMVNLQTIIVDTENERYCSENGVLYSKDKKELICYPEAKIGDSFCIPQGVVLIGNNAFACTKLISITISEKVTTIGNCSFKSCMNLASVTIPESVTSIGRSAFEGAVNLTSATISENVRSIEENAFLECKRLANIYVGEQLDVTRANISAEANIWRFRVEGSQYGKKLVKITRHEGNAENLGKEYSIACSAMGDPYVINEFMEGIVLTHCWGERTYKWGKEENKWKCISKRMCRACDKEKTEEEKVDMADCDKVYKYVKGLRLLTEEEKRRFDITESGEINIATYVKLYRALKGLI